MIISFQKGFLSALRKIKCHHSSNLLSAPSAVQAFILSSVILVLFSERSAPQGYLLRCEVPLGCKVNGLFKLISNAVILRCQPLSQWSCKGRITTPWGEKSKTRCLATFLEWWGK